MINDKIDLISDPSPAPVLQGPKRQHYLPEFYLEEFCKEGMLWIFDRSRNDYRQQQPLNTGVVGHLYTVRDAENRQRFEIEEMLAKVEGDAAHAMRKLDSGQAITTDERYAVAEFIALAFTRTPERLGEIEMLNVSIIEKSMKVMWGTSEQAAKLIEETGGVENCPFTAETIADMVNNGKFRVNVANEAKIDGMLTMANAAIPLLLNMSWVIMHRQTEATSFVTTDSPVRLLPPRGLDMGFYGVGFGMPGSETLFPISSRTCLALINQDGPLCRHIEIDRNQMRGINLTMATGSHKYVIGRDEALIRNIVRTTGIDSKPIVSKLRVN